MSLYKQKRIFVFDFFVEKFEIFPLIKVIDL